MTYGKSMELQLQNTECIFCLAVFLSVGLIVFYDSLLANNVWFCLQFKKMMYISHINVVPRSRVTYCLYFVFEENKKNYNLRQDKK